jgi:hypothetical protein
MAVLKLPNDVDNETIITLQDVFDTFFTKEKAKNKINKNGDTGMTNTFDFTNAIINVVTPELPSAPPIIVLVTIVVIAIVMSPGLIVIAIVIAIPGTNGITGAIIAIHVMIDNIKITIIKR